jgi:hypothetical protein
LALIPTRGGGRGQARKSALAKLVPSFQSRRSNPVLAATGRACEARQGQAPRGREVRATPTSVTNVTTDTNTVFRLRRNGRWPSRGERGRSPRSPAGGGVPGSIRSGVAGIGGRRVFSFGEEHFYPLILAWREGLAPFRLEVRSLLPPNGSVASSRPISAVDVSLLVTNASYDRQDHAGVLASRNARNTLDRLITSRAANLIGFDADTVQVKDLAKPPPSRRGSALVPTFGLSCGDRVMGLLWLTTWAATAVRR